MIDRAPIEEALPVVMDALKKQGVVAEIVIKRVRDEQADEHVQLVTMNGTLDYGGERENFDFWVMVPVPTHQTSANWAWVTAHSFVGRSFHLISTKYSREQGIAFWKSAEEAVYELIEAVKE